MKNTTDSEDISKTVESWIIYGLALLAVVGAIVTGLYQKDTEVSDLPLKYLVLAALLVILRNIKSFAYGDFKAEFSELKVEANNVRNVIDAALTVAELAEGIIKTNTANPSHSAITEEEIKPGSVEDDPWKSCFGESRESNGRVLSAQVTPREDREGWFILRLKVSSLPKVEKLPDGQRVQFFLHDSFPNDRPMITAVKDQAELVLNVWGAFTVGAITDNGKTKLEFDLAEEKSFPRLFRSR
jgi:hypothetical protein